MATIRITNLKLRTIIGANDWERKVKQDVIINISFECNAKRVIQTDSLKDTVDYKALTKEIIKAVENSKFEMLEKLTSMILEILLKNSKIKNATVRIDKPFALRFAESVSVELSQKRK